MVVLTQEPCFPQPTFLATMSTLGVSRPESSFSALAKGQGILSDYGTVTCQGWCMGTGGDDSWKGTHRLPPPAVPASMLLRLLTLYLSQYPALMTLPPGDRSGCNKPSVYEDDRHGRRWHRLPAVWRIIGSPKERNPGQTLGSV